MFRQMASLALGSAVFVGMAHAQAAPQASPFPAVPTTRILAIGHLTGPMTAETRKTIMPDEVSDTARLYLGGQIDQSYRAFLPLV